MLVPGAQETQVVVKFVARVCLIKTAQELCDLGCPRAHEVFQQARHSLFSVVGKLGPRRWNPDRHGLEAVGLEGPRIAKRAIDPVLPPVASSCGIWNRPRPRRIVEECTSDHIDHR
jgi:hypothetical protein